MLNVYVAFSQWNHAVTVPSDIEKAYDTAWKYGIIKDLHHAVVFFGVLSPVCFEFSCQYQCKWLPEKICLWNDLLHFEWDKILLTHSLDAYKADYIYSVIQGQSEIMPSKLYDHEIGALQGSSITITFFRFRFKRMSIIKLPDFVTNVEIRSRAEQPAVSDTTQLEIFPSSFGLGEYFQLWGNNFQ